MKSLKKALMLLIPLCVLFGVMLSANIFAYAARGDYNYVSISVKDNIILHYYIKADDFYYIPSKITQYTVSYNVGDTQNKEIYTSEKISLEDNMDENGYVRIDVPQAPAQIAEPVTIVCYNSNGNEMQNCRYTICAKDYCDKIISMSDEEIAQLSPNNGDKLKNICKAIIAYSKSAQGLFSEYMQQEGSVAITDDYSADLNLDSATYTSNHTKTDGANIRFRKVSFMCESRAKMRFYLGVNNEADPTIYDDPELIAPDGITWEKGTEGDGSYYIQVNNIKPVDFDEQITLNYAGASISMSVLDYAGTVLASPATSNELKTLAKSIIRYSESADSFFDAFTVKLPYVNFYLYRVGNANNVALGTLFSNDYGAEEKAITATVTNIAGNANATQNTSASDWKSRTIRFTGNGVVNVSLKNGGKEVASVKLEVVNGTNYVEGATLGAITSNNAVLLGNVKSSGNNTSNTISITNKKTLYGNGFSVTDTRSSTASTSGYINMSGGGSIDNAVLLGKKYETTVISGNTNEEYAPGVCITGNANIYNSYVSENKNAAQVDAGTVYFENTTFAGGTIANLDIGSGDVTLKNCETRSSDRGGLKGLGIRPKTGNCKLHLIGSFKQYNWLTSSQISASTYRSVLSSVYNNTKYAYTYNGLKYLNMGILFLSESGNILTADAQNAIDDQTNPAIDYDYLEKTAGTITGTVFTAKATMFSSDMLTPPAYTPSKNGQYYVVPTYSFDYTTKNYQAKQLGNRNYCYYDSVNGKVYISFNEGNNKVWDTRILTATKNGNNLSYTVKYKKVGDTAYSYPVNDMITFSESGNYQVEYTYTDPYNYDKNGESFEHSYTQTVNIRVTVIPTGQESNYASINYDGVAGNYTSKKVVGSDNRTYVMPDVSADTENKIGHTTVAGQTVYYPIVSVGPTNNTGNTAYSSGNIYYFAPVFSEIHIKDYNLSTGAPQYEYSKSTNTWPHQRTATEGPNTAYFGCSSGEKRFSNNSPYARSTNSQYYKYGANNLGVCYTTNDISVNNGASNHLVQYYYVSNDGDTYYFYVYYKFAAATYTNGSCIAEGSLIRMADGTQKPVEEIQPGDMVMTYNHYNGTFEAQPILINLMDTNGDCDVITLKFDDGTNVRMVYEHGFFDVDKNTYVYFTKDNVSDYVGDKFVKCNSDGTYTTVTLEDYTITNENIKAYEMATNSNVNFIVEDMLSMPAEDFCPGLYEYFDFGDNLTYDADAMQRDIDTYGLYTYDDFKDYMTENQFNAFNFKYLKPNVEKGKISFEDVIKYATSYIACNMD